MCSQRKLDSARANGAKSHGPKTPEGKAISAMNAVQHGFTSSKLLLPGDNPEELAALREAYTQKFQPADHTEDILIERMVAATWRQQRIWSHETELLDLKMQTQFMDVINQFPAIDQAGHYALAFKSLGDDTNSLQLMNRYETSAAREFDRALRQLIAIRKTDFTQKRDHVCPPTKVIFCGNKSKCDPDDLRPDCHHRQDADEATAPTPDETNPIPQSDTPAQPPKPEPPVSQTNPIPQSDTAPAEPPTNSDRSPDPGLLQWNES